MVGELSLVHSQSRLVTARLYRPLAAVSQVSGESQVFYLFSYMFVFIYTCKSFQTLGLKNCLQAVKPWWIPGEKRTQLEGYVSSAHTGEEVEKLYKRHILCVLCPFAICFQIIIFSKLKTNAIKNFFFLKYFNWEHTHLIVYQSFLYFDAQFFFLTQEC